MSSARLFLTLLEKPMPVCSIGEAPGLSYVNTPVFKFLVVRCTKLLRCKESALYIFEDYLPEVSGRESVALAELFA